MIKTAQVQDYMNYFQGSRESYGQHVYDTETKPGEKKQGTSSTVREKLITIQEYQKHLNGQRGLGIIPIAENSKCRFAVIDVDVYDVDYHIYLNAIRDNNFPIVPFRSKSGGLHLYTFFTAEVSPSKAIAAMKKMAFLLSIDILTKEKNDTLVEIFPKQTKLKPGEVGNWINLPYYNAEDTQTPALRDGKELSLTEALAFIREKQVSLEDLTSFLNEIPLSDAPPCLQTLNILNSVGKGEGRNNYLFSFGIYYKKKDEDEWEFNLRELNKSMPEPIPEQELERTIIKSLKRKDYLYKCKENPCVNVCRKKECEKREYGIGMEGGYFNAIEYGQLTQYNMRNPYYIWEVRLQGQDDYTRLEFKSEDEIIKQDAFLRLCMRKLHELPTKLKQTEWTNKVNQALAEIKIEEVDHHDDTSPFVLVKQMIADFCIARAPAETRDQILVKRVYFNKQTKEYWFRTKDLLNYLYIQKQLKDFRPQEMHAILTDMGCRNSQVRTESRKQVRVCVLPQYVLLGEDNTDFTPDFSADEDF